MAVTQNSYTGNGSTTNYSFTFPYLETTDVKVKLDGVDTTAYSFANATTVQMNSAPANGAKIIIYRNTNNDTKPATFYAGSAIKSEDLNNNYDQILYAVQEIDNNAMSTLGDTAMQGDMLIGQGFGLQFEGATDDAYETRLIAADPTADRVITLPNETGTVILNTNNSIDISDNTKIKLGTGDDLEIYTDGSNSYIKHNGDGDFRIFSGNAESIKCVEGANVSLFHNNVEMAYTHSSGFKLNDNKKLLLGTGNDIQIYHDGSDSFITNTVGHLNIDTTYNIYLRKTGGEEMAIFVPDGSVSLFHNGTKKFETLTGGASVTGALDCDSFDCSGSLNVTGNATFHGNLDLHDNDLLRIGTGDDLILRHNSTNSYVENIIGDLQIKSNALHLRSYTDSEAFLTADKDAGVTLYYDNAAKISTTSAGATVTGTITATAFSGNGSGLTNVSSTVDATANVDLNDNVKVLLGTGDDLEIYHNGTDSIIKNSTGWLVYAGDSLAWKNEAQNEWFVAAQNNSGVELYFDNSKKLETKSYGVKVGGDLWLDDSNIIKVGSGGDLQLVHDASNSYIKDTGTGNLNITASTVNINNADNSENIARFIQNSHTQLYFDNSKKLETNAGGVDISGVMQCDGITLLDNEQFQCGTNVDLRIYHDGGNSWIKETGTGALYIDSDGSLIALSKGGAGETMAKFYTDGAVELYHNNVKRFETTSSGVTVTGNITTPSNNSGTIGASGTVWADIYSNAYHTPDNGKYLAGADGDLQIFHDGSHSIIKNTTNSLYAATGAFLVQNAAQTESQIISSENGSVDLYYDNVKKFETSSEGTLTTGDAVIQDAVYLANTSTISSRLVLNSSNTSSWTGGRDLVAFDLIGNGADHRTGNLSIKIKKAAADASPTEMMRIDGTYNKIRVPDSVQYELGDGGDLQLYHDGSNSTIKNTTGWLVYAGDSLAFKNEAESEWYIAAQNNGAVELYYDNSKKFQTTTNGVKVIGASNSPNDADWATSSSIITSGSYGGGIAMIDGSAGFVQYCEGSGANWWLRSGADDAAPETNIKASHNGTVELYYDNSKKLETNSTGVKITDKLVVGSGNTIDTKIQINTEDTDKDALTLSNWDGSTATNKVTIHFDSSGVGGWNIGMPAATDAFVIENDGGAVALTIDGSNNATFSGAVSIDDKVTQTLVPLLSSLDIDCSTGNYFTKAISANSTFTFSNVPASGNTYGFVLELDVSGDRTLTWPAAVKWAGGSAPTLTASKTHLFSLVTVDGGTTWRGSAAVDFTT